MPGPIRILFTAAILIVLLSVPYSPARSEGVSLDDALAAPAIDLAQAYSFTRSVLEDMLPMAEMGVTVHLGDTEISEDNAAEMRVVYERRLEVYEEAIRARGYQPIAGRYEATATESCARASSTPAMIIQEGVFESIEIVQEGAQISMVIGTTYDGESFDIECAGFTVEQAVVINDPMNGDYIIRGTVADGDISLHPDSRVLDTWPAWAGPPAREDIENCVVKLTRISE